MHNQLDKHFIAILAVSANPAPRSTENLALCGPGNFI